MCCPVRVSIKLMHMNIKKPSYIALAQRVKELESSAAAGKREADTLRENCAVQQSILATTFDGFWLVDSQGKLLDVNPSYCRLSGYSRQELLGMPVSALEALESTAEIADRIRCFPESGHDIFETIHRRKDGSTWHVEVSASYRDFEDGQYVIFLRDITRRKQTEGNLRLSDDKFRVVFERSPIGIMLLDSHGVILDCNQHFCDIFGVSRPDYLGLNLLAVMPVSPVRQTLADAITGDAPASYDGPYTSVVSGRSVHFSIISERVSPELTITLVTDITTRTEAEGRLRLQSEIMRNMAEGVSLVRREDGIIVYNNPRFERMFGYGPGEMIDKNVTILNAPNSKTPAETKQMIMETLDETGEWHGEVENITKDGTRFWCEANVSAFDHPEYGKVSAAVHTDITKRKQAEEKLKKIMDELELIVEERTNELQRKNIALSEVLHQLDIEKKYLESKVNANIQTLLLPVLEKLIDKSSSIDGRYLTMLKQNLLELTSSQGARLSSPVYKLTPKETELCALIKGGFTVKEIALMQNLSERTIESHRYNIRKKLGISTKKSNLVSFLASL